jgi:hypothetical protein
MGDRTMAMGQLKKEAAPNGANKIYVGISEKIAISD